MMEVKLSHKLMKGLVNMLGWDQLLNYLNTTYPQLELYSVSKDWFNDSKFILKARGAKGDLIVTFFEMDTLAF
jgi:hypothetical protein